MPENVNTTALASGQLGIDEEEDNRPVMIDVEHVSMSFNMASEQLNNLKEYAIAIARGKLFFEEFKALDDVSFQVRKGDVFGIMGTNGSGKSTILKIIAGVLEPTKGKCSVNGNIAPLIELGAGFDMDLSARENIYLNGALLGYSKDFINEHFDEIVEFAEVEKFLDMPLKNYSSGMVSRIAFAIATVIVPEILVVDEVLSVGDFMFQKKCENRITQLIEEHGVTVLIVSHSNEQIARLCNKAIWIEKGHTRLIGDAQDVALVYGGLGGRTGSKQSEDYVFQALVNSTAVHDASKCRVIGADSTCATGAKLVFESFGAEKIHSFVLAVDNTHINAIVGNGLAGALHAPLLSTGGVDRLADSSRNVLFEMRPDAIYLLDISGVALAVFDELKNLPWQPDVQKIGEDDTRTEFSKKVFKCGLDRSLWGSSLAYIDFSDNAEAFAAAPFCYKHGIPVLMPEVSEDGSGMIEECAKAINARTVYEFGNNGVNAVETTNLNDSCHISCIGSSGRADSCFEISRYVYEDFDQLGPSGFVCFTSLNNFQWPELQTCGSYCSMISAPLFLMDDRSLDNESRCLSFLNDNKDNIESILIIGDKNGLDVLDQQLLASALA